MSSRPASEFDLLRDEASEFGVALDRLPNMDLPGHGDSAWRGDADYGAETLAPAVGAALEQLAPEAAAIASFVDA